MVRNIWMVSLAVLLLGGCGDSSNSASPDPDTGLALHKHPAAKSSGSAATSNFSDGSDLVAELERQGGGGQPVNMQGHLDHGFVLGSEVPVYPGASEVTKQAFGNGEFRKVIYQTPDAPPQTIQFYEREMKNRGWRVYEPVQPGLNAFAATNPTKRVDFTSAGSGSSPTHITIEALPRVEDLTDAAKNPYASQWREVK